MKATLVSLVSLLAASSKVAAHATFQDLWVDGVDQGATCARLPASNSPVSVGSSDLVCNVGGTKGVAGKCAVAAGGRVTVEMHQQNGDRSCSNEAIGGQHWGPVLVYLSKVSDSSTADGASGGWFKIFQDSWSAVPGVTRGDDDNWGTKDLNTCCGKMDVKIPSNIPSGDYLLRAEVIALHAASPSGGAQFYMTCFQLSVTGGSGSVPATVKFPGAYSQSDPGIGVSIHGTLSSYIAPGPAVVSGGTTKVAGSAGCPATGANTGGSTGGSTGGNTGGNGGGSAPKPSTTTTKTKKGSATTTTAAAPPPNKTTAAAGGGGAGAALYGQCGGASWNGATTCSSGTCKKLNDYYSQCQP